jgi:hypothetical protein
MISDQQVYKREAWSASVAFRALRGRRSVDYREVCRDRGSHVLSMILSVTAATLLILTVSALITAIG